jgi:hypothetical protein
MFEWVSICNALKLAVIVAPLAGIALVGSDAPQTTTSAEEPGVRAALNAYLEGHATGRADAFRRAFQPEARMLSAKDGHLVKTDIADYIARAPGQPAADEDRRRRRIDFVDIVGDAAMAKITLTYPDVTLTDYMTLLKIDGEWRIVSKAFSADRKNPKS